jgi:hypothetical protein
MCASKSDLAPDYAMRIGNLLFAAVLASVQVGCGGSAPTDAGPSIAGAWVLKTLNGANLPAILSVNGTDTTFLEGEFLILPPTGKYSRSSVTLTIGPSTVGSPVSSTASGTYARQGSGYSFNDDSLGVGSGSFTNGMLTIAFGGQVRSFSPAQ